MSGCLRCLNQGQKTRKLIKMKDVVLITGGNGHLAQITSQYLKKKYTVRHLTTEAPSKSQDLYFHWNITKQYIDPKALENCHHIVHLAGFPILKRWTKRNKQIMYDSRVKAAKLLFFTCKKMNIKLKTFISASAIGIYDQSLKGAVNESSPKGSDWLAQMACDWENSADLFKELGSRVIQMRISLIFSNKAGFLKYNLISMKFGLGLILGDKNKKINWIHAKDAARFIEESIMYNEYNGAYNLACKQHISQEHFIKLIKKHLFPYALVINIPIFLVRLILFKRVQIIDTNLDIEAKKIKDHNFKCKFNSLEQILDSLKR